MEYSLALPGCSALAQTVQPCGAFATCSRKLPMRCACPSLHPSIVFYTLPARLVGLTFELCSKSFDALLLNSPFVISDDSQLPASMITTLPCSMPKLNKALSLSICRPECAVNMARMAPGMHMLLAAGDSFSI